MNKMWKNTFLKYFFVSIPHHPFFSIIGEFCHFWSLASPKIYIEIVWLFHHYWGEGGGFVLGGFCLGAFVRRAFVQRRLNAWAYWEVARGTHEHRGHANLCMLCTSCFLMFKHWFWWKYQYNKYMFNFNDYLYLYSYEWLCR